MKCFYCKESDANQLIITGIANPIEESTYSPVCIYCDTSILEHLYTHHWEQSKYFTKPLPVKEKKL